MERSWFSSEDGVERSQYCRIDNLLEFQSSVEFAGPELATCHATAVLSGSATFSHIVRHIAAYSFTKDTHDVQGYSTDHFIHATTV